MEPAGGAVALVLRGDRMTSGSARTLALAAATTATGLAVASTIVRGNVPKVRTAAAGLVLAVLLTAAAGPWPNVAGAFSVLILTTAVLTTGADTLTTITRNLTS